MLTREAITSEYVTVNRLLPSHVTPLITDTPNDTCPYKSQVKSELKMVFFCTPNKKQE